MLIPKLLIYLSPNLFPFGNLFFFFLYLSLLLFFKEINLYSFFFLFHIHVVSSDNLKWSSCFHFCLLNPFLLYMAGRCNFFKSQIISLHFSTLKTPKGISLDFKQKLCLASPLENCLKHALSISAHGYFILNI